MSISTALQLVAARAHLRAAPLILEYELTHLCNLRCAYCDRHTPQPGELTTAQIYAVLEEFRALGTRVVSLDGGEPLAHASFDAIVGFLRERGLRVHVNSNGSLVPRHLPALREVQLLKISLDGLAPEHDAMRGTGAFERARRGIFAAREAGIAVELRCVIGAHNHLQVDALLDLVESWQLGVRLMFQPARSSLFAGAQGAAPWLLQRAQTARAFGRVEARKRAGSPVANRWGSLSHFRQFPKDSALPCAAGWIKATLDPCGQLHHCGMVPRVPAPEHNVLQVGARAAFAALPRQGCSQCWCARAVEGNQAWGGQLLQLTRAPRAGGKVRPGVLVT
jgi:MoaA/NifB/PqqE/SkfB family radical SAM enzyme